MTSEKAEEFLEVKKFTGGTKPKMMELLLEQNQFREVSEEVEGSEVMRGCKERVCNGKEDSEVELQRLQSLQMLQSQLQPREIS